MEPHAPGEHYDIGEFCDDATFQMLKQMDG